MVEDTNGESPSQQAPQVIEVGAGLISVESFGIPTMWQTATFAPLWFQDAVTESKYAQNQNARRKEILFSVAAVESYLLEWVRDEVLDRDFNKLDLYFPLCQHRSITDKWKDIPIQLHGDGLIKAAPALSGETWNQFRNLVSFRNGLIHARSSRPETSGLPQESMPLPTVSQLQSIDAGWAIQVVINLIGELHSATGTRPPSWLHIK